MPKPSLSPKLQQALKACHAVGWTITGEICFGWISEKFKKKGVTYRDLAALARLGYLRRTGQGRYTVYYRIVTNRRCKRGTVGDGEKPEAGVSTIAGEKDAGPDPRHRPGPRPAMAS